MDKKSSKEIIIKDTAKYNIAQYSSQFIGFFTAIAMRSFLGPYLMGLWSMLRVVVDYATFANLGIEGAISYHIPFLKGKGDKKAQSEVTNSAFGFLFATSVFAAIVIIVGVFVLRNRYPLEVLTGLSIVSLYLILQRISSYYLSILRANSRFSVVSLLVIFDAVVNLTLVLTLVRIFKIYGLYVTVILMALLNTLFMHVLARYRIELRFDIKKIYALMKLSLPLLALSVLTTILSSIDKIMIVKMLGVTFVGYYSIAGMAQNYLYGVANNFSIVAMPRLLEAYGNSENIQHIKKFVTVSAYAVSYMLAPILGALYLIIPFFVALVLPKFVPGIIAAQVLLLDIFFRSCNPQASHFLVALGKQVRILPITAIAIGLNAGLTYIFVQSGLGIAGAALGVSISSLFVALATLIYAMKHFADWREIAKFVSKIFFPLIYIAIVIAISVHFINISNTTIKLIVNLLILTAASLPLFFHIDRKTHILRILFTMISKKKNK